VANAVVEAFFPGRCLLCGEWLPISTRTEGQVCGACRSSLPMIKGERCSKCGAPICSEHGICTRCRAMDYAFDSNISLFEYSGEARTLIAEFKFAGRRRLASLFASLVGELAGEMHPGLPIVPVPPRPGRRRVDGVAMIARRLRRAGLRVLPLLVRTGGAPQKSLDFEHRRQNLLGKIAMARGRPGERYSHFRGRGEGVAGSASPPAEVVLLDDVFTTGATADACARVLREAGCARVFVVTLALD
jgi:predicted amidophosphoribosyltransferase